MSAAADFRAAAAKRILIKDGAYGTQIQERRLQSGEYCGGLDLMKDQRGNNDLLNLTRPDVVRSICESFAEAGVDLLATNTFNANSISQADYGAELLVGDINRAAAKITREVADRHTALDGKPRWVAGALGPTNKTLSLSPNVNDPGYREVDFDQVKAVYREQIDAGVGETLADRTDDVGPGQVEQIVVAALVLHQVEAAAIFAALQPTLLDLRAVGAVLDEDAYCGFGTKAVGAGHDLGLTPSR